MKFGRPPFELPLLLHDKAAVTLTTNSWAKRHSSSFDPRPYVYCIRALDREKSTLHYVNNFVFLLECKENEIIIRACRFIGRKFSSSKLLSRI